MSADYLVESFHGRAKLLLEPDGVLLIHKCILSPVENDNWDAEILDGRDVNFGRVYLSVDSLILDRPVVIILESSCLVYLNPVRVVLVGRGRRVVASIDRHPLYVYVVKVF